MNLEYFIARKLSFGTGSSFTKSIIKLAIAGIAIGIAVMIISSSIIRGFRNQITDKIFGFWGNIHITDLYITNSNEPIAIKRDANLMEQIANIDHIEYQEPRTVMGHEMGYMQSRTVAGVESIQSYAMANGIIKTKKFLEGIVLKGVSDDYNWSKMNQYIVQGRKINTELDQSAKEIILSQVTSQRLDIALNDKLIVYFIKGGNTVKKAFKIVGIYKTGLEEYDRRIALVDIRKIREVLKWGEEEIAGYEVITEHFDDMGIISDHLYERVLPGNLYSQTIQEKFPGIFEWLELQKINEWVIMALMIGVCIINMITALIILILERTKMIGVLKSLGHKNWDIRKIFLYQGGIIVIYGLFWGNLLGLGISLLQKYTGFIKLDEKNYYLTEAPIEINWAMVSVINISVLLLVIVCLILPTYIIAKIKPIKVLRFE